jgi:Mce-associated membrane protein
VSDDQTTADDSTTAEVEPTEGVEIDKPTESKEDSAKADTSEATGTGEVRRRLSAVPVIPAVLVLALLAAGTLAAWLYFAKYRPDQQTDDAVAQSVVNAARDGTVALLSYKPDTLEQDFAAARSHLSGDFLNYYNDFTKQVVTPAAKSKGVTTKAQVVGAAPSELQPGSAVVLVFVNQVTTSNERPDPSAAASAVKVSLTEVNGQWLINKFDPL